MSDQQNQKILDLLSAAVTKAIESDSIEVVDELYYQIETMIKTKHSLLKAKREGLYIDALQGKDSGQINDWIVEYKPLNRYALDSDKLKEHCADLGIDLKEQFYSQTFTKPSLKFKAVK